MKIKYILVYLILSLSLPVLSQTVISVPYFCGFENAQDNAGWVSVSGANTNRWTIGNAISSEGNSSLYISADGGVTAGHNATEGFVSVYKDFTLQANQNYRISFEWLNPDNTGKLYVCWFDPSGMNDNIFAGSSTQTLPLFVNLNRQTWAENDTVMQHSPQWESGSFDVRGRGVPMRLLFFWSSASASNQGACIDNVQIGAIKCGRTSLSNLKYTPINGRKGVFSWTAGSTGAIYDLMYKEVDSVNWTSNLNLTSNADTIPELARGRYKVKTRIICGNDTSSWQVDYIYVYGRLEACFDYTDLRSENVVATYGTFQNPYATPGVVDYGYESGNSRVTIHTNQNERDVRTGGRLYTVQPGTVASVRLGNWSTGAKGESVTYDYFVDSISTIMLLNYAVVLQQPSPPHPEWQQPKFTLEVFDQNGYLIDADCGTENFIVGYGSTQNWNKHNDIWWQDWTSFGFNLQQRVGEKIKIRLTTYDCSQGGHYGYAYFSLQCAAGKIEGATCGDNAAETLYAPEGFTYEWFREDNPGVILSTERSLVPAMDDESVYICRMTYGSSGNCTFDLKVDVAPRFPKSGFKPKITYKDCQAEVTFQNTSYTYTLKNKMGEAETFFWDFGDGRTSTQESPKIVYSKGGTYSVSLSAGILEEQCIDVYTEDIVIPELKPSVDTIKAEICQGQYFEYNGTLYSRQNVYNFPPLKSVTDCDSSIVLDLKVNPTYNIEIIDTLFEYLQDFYLFNGRELTESDVYVDSLLTDCGCDSVVTLRLTSYPALKVAMEEIPEMCADELTNIFLDYKVESAYFNTYSVEFDGHATQSGYKNIVQVKPQAADAPVEIEVPKPVRPGIYSGKISFEHKYCGYDTIPFRFIIKYPSAILEQKWNDVIAILNSDYNGGYDFEKYQWHKDGIPIAGADKSYLYLPEKLDFGAEYTVELTRLSDVYSLFTCPVIPVERMEMSVYPTLVSAGQIVTVKTPVKGKLELIDVMGLKIKEQMLLPDINHISVPDRNGVYFLLITDENVEKRTFTVLVK